MALGKRLVAFRLGLGAVAVGRAGGGLGPAGSRFRGPGCAGMAASPRLASLLLVWQPRSLGAACALVAAGDLPRSSAVWSPAMACVDGCVGLGVGEASPILLCRCALLSVRGSQSSSVVPRQCTRRERSAQLNATDVSISAQDPE